MTARVLVVDDVAPNVKLLEAKLASEYFDVLTAYSGLEALEVINREHPDIVLLDVMMPGMDGFEVCRRIKSDPTTMHIPVVMVTALDQPSDRVAGLEAGADDFLTKPLQDIALFARVKSLVRMKLTMDELRNREMTGVTLGGDSGDVDKLFSNESITGRILIVDEQERVMSRISKALSEYGDVSLMHGSDNVPDRIREKNYDLLIISLTMRECDGLRICSKLRSFNETRRLPLLVMVDDPNSPSLVKALEIGVNDYVVRPVDRMEFLARVKTQLRRKKYADKLNENFHISMQMATTDAVTGLFNRHYLTSHLDTHVRSPKSLGKPLTVLMIDIDHFKLVNDTHGHAVGDEVLAEFANRIGQNIRGIDLAARYGGEEFVVMMPDTSSEWGEMVGERLREEIADKPFTCNVPDGQISITASIGVATMETDPSLDTSHLIDVADKALYEAKNSGRNKVLIAGRA